jgi:hypothetical protein
MLLNLQNFELNKPVFFFFWWEWGLNSGIHACKAGALPLKSHIQFILLRLFWRWGGLSNYLPRLALNREILQISASQVPGITGVSHHAQLLESYNTQNVHISIWSHPHKCHHHSPRVNNSCLIDLSMFIFVQIILYTVGRVIFLKRKSVFVSSTPQNSAWFPIVWTP